MKVLIICASIHHFNTLKIAQEIAKVLRAKLVKPDEIKPQDVAKYDLVGFGSGIYFGKHHKNLLEFVDRLPSPDKNTSVDTNFYSVFESRATESNLPINLLAQRCKRKNTHKNCISLRANIIKSTFIFSTRGATLLGLSHKALRDKLIAKGFNIVDEFSCFGYDTFGPYGLIGGLKKGHPNTADLARARDFAQNLIRQ